MAPEVAGGRLAPILAGLGTVLVGALALAPVWTSPVLATNDGPSHVYNAALAHDVRLGRAPYAAYFEVERGLRPNVASHSLLVLLGPRLGWEAAERVVVTLAMGATFASLVALAMGSGVAIAALLAPLAGWLASSWFVWGGGYDFALSVPCYAGLLLALRLPPPPSPPSPPRSPACASSSSSSSWHCCT